MTPVFHHYISKFYLKHFAAEKIKTPNIYRYDKKYLVGRMASTGKSAGEDHFNTVPWLKNPAFFEDAYNKLIETPSVEPFRSTIRNKEFGSEKDLNSILLFFALTTTRNPTERSLIEGPMRKIDEIITASALGNVQAAPIIQTMRSKSYPVSKHIEMEIEIIDPIYEALKGKFWSLHQGVKEAGDFITGDYPLIILRADSAPPWGLNSPNAVIYAPISSDLAMLGTSAPLQDTPPLSKSDIAALNGRIFHTANRYVFSRSKSFPIDLLDGSPILNGLE